MYDERQYVVTVKVPREQINHDGMQRHIYGEMLSILKQVQYQYGDAVEITMGRPRAD